MSEPVPDAGLSAGEAARRIGVAVTTIRTWDRRYGLGPSYREPGRHRRYSEHDLARLELMRRLTIDGVDAGGGARLAQATSDPAPQAPLDSRPRPPQRPTARTPGTAKGFAARRSPLIPPA